MLKSVKARLGAIFIKPELAFVILAIPFGLFSAIAVPHLSAADENMHFLKAYHLASGSIGSQDCHHPEDIQRKVFSIYEGDYGADFTNKVDSRNIMQGTCGSAASYAPIMHAPQAAGIFLAKLINPTTGLMTLFARLVNLSFFVIAAYYIIKKVRIGKWAFTVIALFPLSIHLAASVSADVMNNVIVLAFIAFVFNLFVQKNKLSKKQLAVLLALTCLLALTKATNVLLLFLLLFLPVKLFGKDMLTGIPFNTKKWAVILLCAVLSALCFIGWQQIYSQPLVSSTSGNLLEDNPAYFPVIFYNTYINPFIDYGSVVLRGVVGEFSSFQYHLPLFMVLFCLIIFLLALLHKNSDEEKSIAKISAPLILGSLGALALVMTAVTYALYTAWATLPERLGPNAIYADGVQGRYFLAILVLLIPFFIWLRSYVQVSIKSDKSLGTVIALACALSLLFYSVETYLYLI